MQDPAGHLLVVCVLRMDLWLWAIHSPHHSLVLRNPIGRGSLRDKEQSVG